MPKDWIVIVMLSPVPCGKPNIGMMTASTVRWLMSGCGIGGNDRTCIQTGKARVTVGS